MLYQPKLPHQSTGLYLTDGGLETTLVFLEGHDLPQFAAYPLLHNAKGYRALLDYYRRYLSIAEKNGASFILESPTWRANPDWIEKIEYPGTSITDSVEIAIRLLDEARNEFLQRIPNIVLSGCIGPRGDGYNPQNQMSILEAKKYHSTQIAAFKQTAVNIISALTMNYAEEAAGIAMAAAEANFPVVISFTVETHGKLPTGMGLEEAIHFVDHNVSVPPIYYMINCAHPTHFAEQLKTGRNQAWTKRIQGIRANASCKSHAELDEATELDRGNPKEFGAAHKNLKIDFPHLNVFGGCCGTDEEHIHEMVSQFNLTE